MGFEAPGEVNQVFLVMHYNYEDTYCESVWREEADAVARASNLHDADAARRQKQGGEFMVEMRPLG